MVERWYGFRRSILVNGVTPTYHEEKPNGSNMYLIKKEDLDKLPPSHVPIQISPPHMDDYETIEKLKDKINDYITAPGSTIKIVADIVIDDGVYYPVYIDGSNITVPVETMLKLRANFNQLPDSIEPGDNNTNVLFDEPYFETIALSYYVNELEADYLSKTAFVYGAADNQWLKPYANRVSYKVSKETSFVILPYWCRADLDRYLDIIDNQDIIPLFRQSIPKNTWYPAHIKLIDDMWYPLPTDEYREPPSLDWSMVTWEGRSYSVSEINSLPIPLVNQRLKNLARASVGDYLGLLPFEKKYPDVRYTDGDKMIKVIKDKVGMVVILTSIDLILGIYPESTSYDLLKKTYIDLWNDGQILNNTGNYTYYDSFTQLDVTMVNKLDDNFLSS